MNIIPAKTPEFVKSLFPNFVWTIPTDRKELYLTFDDGPTPEISEWVLETINNYNAKATFFCIGHNIASNPAIFSSMINQGHAIGNHTFNHLKGWKVKTQDYIEDIEATQELMLKEVNTITIKNKLSSTPPSAESLLKSKLFRPPYGKFKSTQSKIIQDKGYTIVLWDILSFDWDKSITGEQCLNNVISKAKPGSIVVFHDSLKAHKNLRFVLPKVLEHFSNKGYSFKAIY